jgi:hypothetical protein
MESKTFTFRQVGTTGCEIVGPDGVIAWTVDSAWAVLVVALLNGTEEVSLTAAPPTRT